MSQAAYIGVDVGTTITKAAAIGADGAELHVEAVPTALLRPDDDRVEQDIGAVLDAVAGAVRQVARKLPAPPALVAITGQGDGLWLLDAAGDPVRPAVSWLDARGRHIVERWAQDGTADLVFERNGGMLFSGASAVAMAALEETEPEALDAAATAAHCKDVVFADLTGERSTDRSDASFPFLDPAVGAYDEQILDACGLGHRRGLLPPVTAPAGPSAPLTSEAATRLGLPAGLPVSAGPYDLPAAARGCEVTAPGDGLLIVGTTLACLVVTDDPGPIRDRAGLLLGTWEPQRWLRAMPAMVGTASLDWLLELTGTPHARLGEALRSSPPGARGVSVAPFWSAAGERAPFVDPHLRGAIEGLHVGIRPADLIRALCEGLAFAARHCFEAAGLTNELTVCGGGSQSPAWMQLFADVLGRPLTVAELGQAGARGAVRSALDARGTPDGWSLPSRRVQPDTTNAAFYERAFGDYLGRVAQQRGRTTPSVGQ